MKIFHLAALLVVVAFATGCPQTRTPMPGPLKDQLIKNRVNRLVQLANDYDNAVQTGGDQNLARAMIFRNELIYQVQQLIDDNYNQFENDLFNSRATGNVAGDMLELGLSAATGITNGERVKTILGIALTAIKGTRKSIDSNYFRERTTEVIAMRMRASRAQVLQVIHRGIALPVGQYPLGAGLDDLINYLYAGSINAALIDLAQDTGATAKVARAEAARLKIQPFLSEGLGQTIDTIDTAREEIFLNLSSGSDETREKTAAGLRKALPKFGYTEAEVNAADIPGLRKLLGAKIRQATKERNETLLNTIHTELNGILDGLP
ncbi:MAG TPA: hypothetical protein VFZ22_24115 [Pyrinomonadaceae bacterium]|nr:hypothetical protein [Pyrinomonadaceae bacterium]